MLLTDLRCSDAAAIPLLRIDQVYSRYHNDEKRKQFEQQSS